MLESGTVLWVEISVDCMLIGVFEVGSLDIVVLVEIESEVTLETVLNSALLLDIAKVLATYIDVVCDRLTAIDESAFEGIELEL